MRPQKAPIPTVSIIHQENGFILLNKPAGLDCQNSRPTHPSLVDWLEKKFGYKGLVHRLDFGTSGIMIAAKNAQAARVLTDKMQSGAIERTYRAIVIGKVIPASGILDSPIEDKPCKTHYKVLETFNNATLLELKLETGRKHQIRIHVSQIGHPIIGDHLYKKAGSHLLLKRPALHSYQIKVDNKNWVCPLPKDMDELLQRLRKSTTPLSG